MAILGDIYSQTGAGGVIDLNDVLKIYDIVRGSQSLPAQHTDEFRLSNVGEKAQYQGPGFFEILKIVQMLGTTINYEEGEIGTTLADGKGMRIDAIYDSFVVSSPYALVENYFDDPQNASEKLSKITGYVKVYSKSDGIEYSEYDLVFPPLSALNSDSNFIDEDLPQGIGFGKDSVAIDGNYLAVPAYYNNSGRVYLYEKEEGGYVYKHTIEKSWSGSPIVEIYGDWLFVGNYTDSEVEIFSISNVINASDNTEFQKISLPSQFMALRPDSNYIASFGISIVCTDGKNLYIGAPDVIATHTINTESHDLAAGAVFHYVYSQNVASHAGINKWLLANTILPIVPEEMKSDTEDADSFYGPSGPAPETSDYIDISVRFGLHIDAENKNDSSDPFSSYLVVSAPRWWTATETVDHRSGQVFVYETAFTDVSDDTDTDRIDELDEDLDNGVNSLLKTIDHTDVGIASFGPTDTRRVFELGRSVSLDKSHNIYFLFNNPDSTSPKLNLYKYDKISNDGGSVEWTQNDSISSLAFDVIEGQSTTPWLSILGGRLAIDTSDLIYGNEFDTSNNVKVIKFPTETTNQIQALRVKNSNVKKKVSDYIAIKSSNESACCDDFENKIETYGDNTDRPSVSGVSVQHFEPGGKLCFHDLNIDGLSYPYGVTIDTGDNIVYGKIKATGKFTDNEVVYTAPTGKSYRGSLDSSIGFGNILSFENTCGFNVDDETPVPPVTFSTNEMVEKAGNPDQHGLIILSYSSSQLCETFEATGSNQTFIVPSNVTKIFAQVWGAGGSSGRYKNAGGSGGYSEGSFSVTEGEKLIIGVGQTSLGTHNNNKRVPGYSPGGSAGAGGNARWPSGGNTSGAGAGGGMSGIFRDTISAENALLIAGGGGGAAGATTANNAGGGAGGGESGTHGMRNPNDNRGGKGGTQTTGGAYGSTSVSSWLRGGASSGSRFKGGNGATAGQSSGGGGGAGWFGGGGGSTDFGADYTGGGGSGYLCSEIENGKMHTGASGKSNSLDYSTSYLPENLPCKIDDTIPTPTPTPTYFAENKWHINNIDLDKSGLYNQRQKIADITGELVTAMNPILNPYMQENPNTPYYDFVHNSDIDLNELPSVTEGGGSGGFNYQFIIALKTPITITKGSKINFNFVPDQVNFGTAGGERNGKTNLASVSASLLSNLSDTEHHTSNWNNCVCCPFYSFDFEKTLGSNIVDTTITNINYLMFAGLLAGCNGKPNYKAVIQSLVIQEAVEPTPTPTQTFFPECKHTEDCSDVAFHIKSSSATKWDLVKDNSDNNFPIQHINSVKYSEEYNLNGDVSISFDGDGAYLLSENLDKPENLELGKDDFTIESWFQITGPKPPTPTPTPTQTPTFTNTATKSPSPTPTVTPTPTPTETNTPTLTPSPTPSPSPYLHYGNGVNENGPFGAPWWNQGRIKQEIYHYDWEDNDVTKIVCGVYTSHFLKKDGSVWSSGRNTNGQLGIGGYNSRYYQFTKVIDSGIKDICSSFGYGSNTLIVIKNDDTLWGMGYNENGQLGIGNYSDQYKLTKITTNVKEGFTGSQTMAVIKKDGSLWTCGRNESGQLGNGNNSNSNKLIKIVNDSVINASCAHNFIMFVKSDGSLWGMGNNQYGILGIGGSENLPKKLINSGVSSVHCGSHHAHIIKQDGSMWSIGYNKYGQLGDGTNSTRNAFVKVMESGVKSIEANLYGALILTDKSELFACGLDTFGFLSYQVGASARTPIRVEQQVKLFSLASIYSLYIKDDSLDKPTPTPTKTKTPSNTPTPDPLLCNPNLIYVKEPGNDTIPANKIGFGGVWEKSTYSGFEGDAMYDRLRDFNGNEKPSSQTGGLINWGTPENPNWTPSTEEWGYTDYVIENDIVLTYDSDVFKFYDENLKEVGCIANAKFGAFKIDNYVEKVPLEVTVLESKSEICKIVKDIVFENAKPTWVKYGNYIMEEIGAGSQYYVDVVDVSDDSDKYRESSIYFSNELKRWIFYSDTTPQPWEGKTSVGWIAWSEQTDCPIYPWDVAWPVIPGTTFMQNLYTGFIYDEANNLSGKQCVQYFPKDEVSSSKVVKQDIKVAKSEENHLDECYTQLGQLIIGEEQGEKHGSSVGISQSGRFVVVGSPHNDEFGKRQGQTRVYEFEENDWKQVGCDINGDSSSLPSRSGGSVAINKNGSVIIVGAEFKSKVDQNIVSNTKINHGHARVYKYRKVSKEFWDNANTKNTITSNKPIILCDAKEFSSEKKYWVQLGLDIEGRNAGDGAGSSVDISAIGNVVAIGSPTTTIKNENSVGEVRVFKYLKDSWVQLGNTITGIQTLGSSSANNFFGNCVKLNDLGTTIAIGAKQDSSSGPGFVKVYNLLNETWVQQGEVLIGKQKGDNFGFSLSLNKSGDVLSVGSPDHESRKGKVDVFKFNDTKWELQKTIVGDEESSLCGKSVSLNSSGNVLSVGCPGTKANLNSCVKVYIYKENKWNLSSTINAQNDLFGNSVSLNSEGDKLACGSPSVSSLAKIKQGYTSVFNLHGCGEYKSPTETTDSLVGMSELKPRSETITTNSVSSNRTLMCCKEFDNTIDTYGDGVERPSVAGVSVQQFEAGGSLCFDDLIIDGLSHPYGVTIVIDGKTIYGKVKATGKFVNTEVVYVSPSGDFYRGKLESTEGFNNNLIYVGNCNETLVVPQDYGVQPFITSTDSFSLFYNSQQSEIKLLESNTLDTIYSANITLPTNTWTHLAVVRKDNILTFYVNGKKVESGKQNNLHYNKPSKIEIGRGRGDSQVVAHFTGVIDSLKITKNFAKYSCNFDASDINSCFSDPETPTPTPTPTPTETISPTPSPTETPRPEKTLRVYSNISGLASSVTIGNTEKYIDEFESFYILPGTDIKFLPATNENYIFSRLYGDIDWLDTDSGKMPNKDVDVYFEYKRYNPCDLMPSCEEECQCDEEQVEQVRKPEDPRITLDFKETDENPTEFTREVEFEDNLPKTPGKTYNYQVSMGNEGPIITSVESGTSFTWRDLVLVRGNTYMFRFLENDSIFKLYDEHGNELGENDNVYVTEEWIYPLIVMPTNATPEFLTYKLSYRNNMGHGNVVVRNINHISGTSVGYNYLFGSVVTINYEGGSVNTSTKRNGVYYTSLGGYYDANDLHIKSDVGSETMLEFKSNVSHSNVPGYFDTNVYTTLFRETLMENKNYRETRRLLNKFLGLHDVDLLKHDFITTFMWTHKLKFNHLVNLLFINLLCEYASKHDKFDKFIEVLKTRVLSDRHMFKFENDYYISDLLDMCELDNSFADIYSVIYIKSLKRKYVSLDDDLNNLYANINLVNNEVITSPIFSPYMYHENYDEKLESLKNDIGHPMILPEKILLRDDDCTDSYLGRYVIKRFDDLFARSLFGTNKPEDEMLKNIYNKSIRLRTTTASVCYKVLPFAYNLFGIHDDADTNEIIAMFDSTQECCDLVNMNENFMDTIENQAISEQEIIPFNLIEAGGSRSMLSESISNMSHPIEKIGSNEYRIYVDKKLNRGAIAISSPGYITTTRETANKIMYRGIDIGYNSGIHTHQIRNSIPATNEIEITTTWMVQDGTLNIVPNKKAKLQVGDFITIRDAKENKILEGTHRISEIAENSFSINFRIPPNMNISAMQNMTAKFDSVYSTKIYCNTEGMSIGNEVVFDYASGGGRTYQILNISKDDAGVYILVDGIFETNPKIITKSHFNLDQQNHVKFTYETKVAYYTTTETDMHTHSLWLSHLPDITEEGRYGDNLSFIQIFHEDMNIYTSE